MSLVTKQDILKPEGQKFGIGDLVRVKKEEDALFDNSGLHRVLGSYFQLHGDGDMDVDTEDCDEEEIAEIRREAEEETQGTKEEYSLCRVDDRESAWAWCDESRMEAVPEDAIQGESA